MHELTRLELALLDKTGLQLDLYLEVTKSIDIISDIEYIRKKAVISTDAGVLKEKIIDILNHA